MAILRPFKALRPIPELVEHVASLPYDVMNRDEASAIAKNNKYSFLHVDKAEIDIDPEIDPYDNSVYQKAKENLHNMINEGVFIQDDQENLYIYKQIMNNRYQVGLVGCTSIDDYLMGIIKKHEYTRPDKEQDRINHVDICNAHTGPIFLIYRSETEINQIINNWMEIHPAVYDFVTEDNIQHIIWVINNQETVETLRKIFSKINSIYIADGHHRTAAATKAGIKRREQMENYNGSEEFNFFLSVLFPDEHPYIMDYNRVVKDLNNHSADAFIDKIKEKFDVLRLNTSDPYKPREKHTFGMYLDGNWYKLTAKNNSFDDNDPVGRLDVSILQNNLLSPILGIHDPRTDRRIDFIGGIRGLSELEKRVNSDMKVAFSLYPTTIDDLMAISDAGAIMPPKSTWFEPKLRTGLFIHKI